MVLGDLSPTGLGFFRALARHLLGFSCRLRRGSLGRRSRGFRHHVEELNLRFGSGVRDDEGPLQPVRGVRILVGAWSGREGLELFKVRQQVHLLEFLEDPCEGAVLAENEVRVADEVDIVLNRLDLDPNKFLLGSLEDAVDQDGECENRDGAALWAACRAFA